MRKLTTITIILILIQSTQYLSAQDWHLTGNAGTNPSTQFLGTTDNKALKLRTNNSVRLTISSAGKVGIGTSSPASKLDVTGSIIGFDSYFGKTYPISAGTSGASYSSVGYGLTFTDTTANYRYRISDPSSMINFHAGGFIFNTAPVGTAGNIIPYSPVMTILQNGNVGIGSTTPGYKLYVTASLFSGTPIAFIENTGGAVTSDGLHIKAGSNTQSGATLIKFMRADGTIIGTINQNSTTSVNYSSTSDKRLKNIIGASQKGLSDLMKINIYDYTFISDPNKKVLTGFMAQELYEIFPQSVSKPRENNEPAEKNPWMVDYGSVTPLIIKCVQELSQKVDAKDEEIENLKSQLLKLQSSIKQASLDGFEKSEIHPDQSGPKSDLSRSDREIPSLGQNIPNPFDNSTLIPFRIPKDCNDASIMITNTSTSEVISVIPISCYEDHVSVDAGTLASGTYSYTLYVDGKMIDTKSMELLK